MSDPRSADSRPTGPSRRELLGRCPLLAAGLLGARPSAARVPRTVSRSGRDVLVQLFLRGGLDGLSLVVPHGDGDYYAARPRLAVPRPGRTGGALDLDGFFGLAPAAAPLLTPYSNGHLAFAHASGSTDPTRSHFEAFAKLELGIPGLPVGSATDGWLTRHLSGLPAPSNGVLRAMGIGDILPLSLLGADLCLPVEDPSGFSFPGSAATAPQRSELLARMHAEESVPVRTAAEATLGSIGLLAGVDFAGYVPSGGAVYPATELGRRLRDAACLIKARTGVEAIHVDHGNWDLHTAQGPLDGDMALLMDDLARSLEAFYLDLLPMIAEVCVVCVSEFGRRLAENSSVGTDHGHGGVLLALGGGIAGGQVLGTWPGLAPANLDQGSLAVTTDYRDVVGEILVNRLGCPDPTAVFPQHVFSFPGITA